MPSITPFLWRLASSGFLPSVPVERGFHAQEWMSNPEPVGCMLQRILYKAVEATDTDVSVDRSLQRYAKGSLPSSAPSPSSLWSIFSDFPLLRTSPIHVRVLHASSMQRSLPQHLQLLPPCMFFSLLSHSRALHVPTSLVPERVFTCFP